MIQVFKDANYDFMKRGRLLLTLSALFTLLAIGILVFKGLQLGIEFSGGTELQLKFLDPTTVGEVRTKLLAAGIEDPVVTTIGKPEQQEIYIKLVSHEGVVKGDELAHRVTGALRSGAAREGLGDLNVIDAKGLEVLLAGAPDLPAEAASKLAQAIAERRSRLAIFRAVDDLADLPGMTPEILEYLRQRTFAGPVVLRSQSYIGPAVGSELLWKAFGAIVGSLIGMLVYIWIRFEFEWGCAAVLAVAHDTLITLGLFALLEKEMSLSVVAAFLTLVGYSVNDTVVVFDRVRENLRLRIGGGDLSKTINMSVNQTLSRTIITSGLTFISVFVLLLFGGAALSGFSFVLTVGIVVGTYSSVFVASALLMLWKEFLARRAGRPAVAATPQRARKFKRGAAD